MSVELSLDLSGLDRLREQLPDLADQTVRRIALDVEGLAKRGAPVDTGLLRSTIQMHDPRRGDFEAQVDVGTDYGLYVHEGAQGRKPRPFLAEALRQAERRAETRLQELARQMEER